MANNQLLASDNFASGSLAAGWTAFSFFGGPTKVVAGSPNVSEPQSTTGGWGQYWSALTWPNDQISEVTVNNLSNANNTLINLIVRAASSTQARYQVNFIGNDTSYEAQVFVISASGTATQLGSTVTGLTISNGDILSIAVIGISISVYQNYNRIFWIGDATWKSGFPGFEQAAPNAITDSKVSSWRGYSAVQQDGVWTKQQVVATPFVTNGSEGLELHGPIIYEGNAQILSGTVYKALFDGSNNVYYAESIDAINWTFYGSPTPVLSGYSQTGYIKVGSTYYLYCQASPSGIGGNIYCYTSLDMVNWTQKNTDCISGGGGGAWDSYAIYPFYALAYAGGTFYGLYGGCSSNSYLFSTGLATSTDGISWTKYSSGTGGPVITNGGNASGITKVGSTYYTWCQTNQPGQGNASAPFFDPTESVRYKSTDLINWTKDVQSVHHSGMAESVNANKGYCLTIGYLFQVGSETYSYLNIGGGDAFPPVIAQIMLSTCPLTIAEVVGGKEDAVAYVATDAFTNGAGNLSANWTLPTGGTKLKIISGPYVEPTSTSTVCVEAYTGAAFSANHFSEATLEALTGTLGQSILYLTLCTSLTAATRYEAQILSPTGTSDAAARFAKRVAGSPTVIGPTITVEPQVGDVWRASVKTGSDGFPVLSLYQNGFLILQVQDISALPLTTGGPGLGAYSSVAIADAQISSWAGGNAGLLAVQGSLGPVGAAATVSYSGPTSGSVTAEANGNYSIPNLEAGTYTITPTLSNVTFTPSATNQTFAAFNIFGVNFTSSQNGDTYDPTKPYIGTVRIVLSAPVGSTNPFVGKYLVLAGAPTTLPNGTIPYLGNAVVGSAGSKNDPLLGQVVVVESAPAGVPDPFLGTVDEE